MMTGREMIFAVVIAAVAASLLLDILGFVFHTLPNFLRQAKIKENPVNPDSAVLARVLSDMEFLDLVELKPDQDGKLRSSAIDGKPHRADDQKNISKKAA
jgi:hypothetical protein